MARYNAGHGPAAPQVEAAYGRAEDLADWGETTYSAATRLGIAHNSLAAWCRNNGQTALWARLVANGETRPGRVPSGRVAIRRSA